MYLWSVKLPLLILFSLCLFSARAQSAGQVLDSLRQLAGGADSSFHDPRLDSLQQAFHSEHDSLQQRYQSTMAHVQDQRAHLQHQIDSLKSRQLPTGPYQKKLDSLHQRGVGLAGEYEDKVRNLQSRYTGKIQSLNLPPEASAQVKQVTDNITKLSVPGLPTDLGLKLPDLGANLPGGTLPDVNVPGVDALKDVPALKTPGLPDVGGDVGKLTGEAGALQDKIKTATGSVKNVNTAGAALENQVADASGVKEALGKTGQLGNMGGIPTEAAAQEQLKKEMMNQATQVARDHFAGKEEALQQAMATMAKYKQKYSSLNSLSDIPKRRPNEMRDKPLIERLLPGVGLQVLRRENWVYIDVNPYVGYRFNGQFTAGAGWNQRVGYHRTTHTLHLSGIVYGPRFFAEYKIGLGISPRVEMEWMNTDIPPLNQNSVDPPHREWVPGTHVGIKKDYAFFGRVRGTAMIMTRLYHYHHKSPYADVVNVRVGFEFPMKKKQKAAKG